MAVADPQFISLVAGTTFSSGNLYTGVSINSSGHAVLYSAGDADSTGGFGIVGTLYSQTATTSAAGVESVTIASANSPSFKALAAGSTIAAGGLVTFSSADGHAVAATTNDNKFIVLRGSSGSTGRILEIARA